MSWRWPESSNGSDLLRLFDSRNRGLFGCWPFCLPALELAFRLFAARLGGAAFFAGRALTVAFTAVFRAGAFAAVALLALGFEAVFALTARFAVLAEVRFAADRDVDRRKPFVRLLLILMSNLKRLLRLAEQPQDRGAA